MRRSIVVLLAVTGLALAAGVTYAAGRLVSQPIGLTGEPATLDRSLAPEEPDARTTAPSGEQTGTGTVTRPTTTDGSSHGSTDTDDDGSHHDDGHDDDDD